MVVMVVALAGLAVWGVRRGYQGRAQDLFKQGLRAFEEEKPEAALHLAQAVKLDPGSSQIREALTRCFSERPGLAFYERVEAAVPKTPSKTERSLRLQSDHASVQEGSKLLRLLAGQFVIGWLGPHGRFVVTVSKAGETNVWDVEGSGYRTLPGRAEEVVFTPAGTEVVVLRGEEVQAYDCASGEALGTPPGVSRGWGSAPPARSSSKTERARAIVARRGTFWTRSPGSRTWTSRRNL